MSDFKLFNQSGYFYDFNIEESGNVTKGSEVESAVIISIFTDRRADDIDEVLDGNYKGWWGDTYQQTKIGSRLWTLKRKKATIQTLILAREILEECLQWLVDDGVAKKVEVFNEWSSVNIGRMNMLIKVYKPDGDELEFKFNEKWGVDD